MLEENKIHQGDCMELMQHIPDKSVDMILCDLPYGVIACEWDKPINLKLLWQEYKRIIKDNSAIVLTASQPFTLDLINSNREWFRYCWIWVKNNITGCMLADKQPMRQYEDIIVFYNKQPTYNPQLNNKPKGHIRRNNTKIIQKSNVYDTDFVYKRNEFRKIPPEKCYPTNVLHINYPKNSNQKIHPTEKPIELFRYLIKTYTQKGELVLDNCIGSGTTAVACKQANRRFIGIEIHQEYVDIANKRLKQKTVSDFNPAKQESLIRAKSQSNPTDLTPETTSQSLRGV